MTSTVPDLEEAIFGSSNRFKFLLWIAERQRPQFFVSRYHMETGKKFAGATKLCRILADAGYLKSISAPSRTIQVNGQPVDSFESPEARWFERVRDQDEQFWEFVLLFAQTWGATTLPSDAPRVSPRRGGRDVALVDLAAIEAGLRG